MCWLAVCDGYSVFSSNLLVLIAIYLICIVGFTERVIDTNTTSWLRHTDGWHGLHGSIEE